MLHYLMQYRFVPWDKSDGIRKTWLDIINSNDKVQHSSGLDFLRFRLHEVSTDLQAMYVGGSAWMNGDRNIYVGESGTVYRFMRLKAWQEGRNVEFIKEGSLLKRKMYDNPDVLEMTPEERLALDGGTSQWESAAYICGLSEKIDNPPEKLQLTYDCVEQWKACKRKRRGWHFTFDMTILRQAVAYLRQLHLKERIFEPRHSEDYCFARAFEYMTREEGEARWPQLKHHESNRLDEMETELERMLAGGPIKSDDHRVMANSAMRAVVEKKKPVIINQDCAKKSWPEFMTFILHSPHLNFEKALELV